MINLVMRRLMAVQVVVKADLAVVSVALVAAVLAIFSICFSMVKVDLAVVRAVQDQNAALIYAMI